MSSGSPERLCHVTTSWCRLLHTASGLAVLAYVPVCSILLQSLQILVVMALLTRIVGLLPALAGVAVSGALVSPLDHTRTELIPTQEPFTKSHAERLPLHCHVTADSDVTVLECYRMSMAHSAGSLSWLRLCCSGAGDECGGEGAGTGAQEADGVHRPPREADQRGHLR